MDAESIATKPVYARMERHPVCVRCGGTGYVYLWSFERVGARVWFCDRCKRSWGDAGTLP